MHSFFQILVKILMIMRRFVKCIRSAILKLDLFPATQFLTKDSLVSKQIQIQKWKQVRRYRQQEEYKTVTGGVISIAIIVLFTIIFYRLGIQTANKQIINSSITYQSEVQPESITINFKEGSDFMFAIGVIGFNLSDITKKYLNITLGQNIMDIASNYFNFTSIPLVQCTPSHFSYNSDTLTFYKNFNISGMLCPPLNYDFSIGGRPTSSKFEALSIYIRYCNNTIDPICANDTQLDDLLKQIGYFSMITPVLNTLVNPGEQNYKSIYIEDRNYYYFTNTAGLQLNAQIQQYQIDTDISLMPWKNVQSEYINAIPNLMQFKSKTVLNNLFAQVKFIKSGISTTFARSFNKIDDYLSYVGGLVGTILILFFILNFYSEKSYLVSIATQIYSISQKSSTEFNFFYLISTNIHKLLGICGIKTKWEDSTKFLLAMEEMQKQLSIDFILKKINYLQAAVHSILGQHQIKTIYLSGKKSITAVANERKKYFHPNKFIKSSKIHNTATLDNPDPASKQNDLSKQSFGAIVQSREIQEVDESQNTESHQYSNKQQMENSFKNSLEQVVQESIQGNAISRRIIQKLGKKIYPQIQILIQNQSSKIKIEESNNKKSLHQQKNGSFMNFQFQQGINT